MRKRAISFDSFTGISESPQVCLCEKGFLSEFPIMVMPFGTKEIAESSANLTQTLETLISSTQNLATMTSNLVETTNKFSSHMTAMNAGFDKMAEQIALMQKSMDNLATGFQIQMTALNENLQHLGKLTNLGETLNIRKILPGILKGKTE